MAIICNCNRSFSFQLGTIFLKMMVCFITFYIIKYVRIFYNDIEKQIGFGYNQYKIGSGYNVILQKYSDYTR